MVHKKIWASTSKNVGELGFFKKARFSLEQFRQLLAHSCQNRDINLKFGMRCGIDIILCVKFDDDLISSLDFSFIGGVPLNNYSLHRDLSQLNYSPLQVYDFFWQVSYDEFCAYKGLSLLSTKQLCFFFHSLLSNFNKQS